MPTKKNAESETESQTGQAETPEVLGLYERLSAPFDVTYKRSIGGRELTYITGEQVTSRLNEVLGFMNWDWTAKDSGITEDEVWVKGELTVRVPNGIETYPPESTKTGFGGKKIARSRSDGKPLSIGNETKAADTDAFKKAAAKFGVGLYLSERSEEELPASTPAYSAPYTPPTNLNPVAFANAQTGDNQITGTIEAKNKAGTGVLIAGSWYNPSRNSNIDLGQFNRGELVTLTYSVNGNFKNIESIARGGPASVPDTGSPAEEDSLAF